MTRHTLLSSHLSSLAHVGLAGVLAVGALGATACSKRHEQQAEHAAEKAGEAAEKVGEKVGAAAEKAGEKISDAAEKLGEKIGPASEDARLGSRCRVNVCPRSPPPPGLRGWLQRPACCGPARSRPHFCKTTPSTCPMWTWIPIR